MERARNSDYYSELLPENGDPVDKEDILDNFSGSLESMNDGYLSDVSESKASLYLSHHYVL